MMSTVTTVEGRVEKERAYCALKVEPLDRSCVVDLSRVLISELVTTEEDKPPKKEDIEGYPHLEGVSFPDLENKLIGLLLSAEYAWTWEQEEIR